MGKAAASRHLSLSSSSTTAAVSSDAGALLPLPASSSCRQASFHTTQRYWFCTQLAVA